MEFYELGVYAIEGRFRSLMMAINSLCTPKNECLLDYGGSTMPRLPSEVEEYYSATFGHFSEATETQLFSLKEMEFWRDIIFFWSIQPRVVQLLVKLLISDLNHLRNMPLEKQMTVARVCRPWLHARKETGE